LTPVDSAVSNLLQEFHWNRWFTESFWPENERRVRMTLGDVSTFAPPPGRLLDIGCANGFQSYLFARMGYFVTATDAAEVVQRPALFAKEGINFFASNLNDPDALAGLENGSFDAAVMGEVIEHVFNHPLGLLREVARVLKPGGVLVLTTPNPNTLINAARFIAGRYTLWGTEAFVSLPKHDGRQFTDIGDVHFREYRTGEVHSMLSASGFAVQRTAYMAFGAAPSQPTWKRALKAAARPALNLRLFGATQYVLATRLKEAGSPASVS
jgi:2-polyprenyl-3-methyl-5-hydroxy-6-metoxy-1,4-benzoquinol methylase